MALLITSLLLSLALAEHSLIPRAGSRSNSADFIYTTTNKNFTEWIERANASTVRNVMLPDIHLNEYPAEGVEVAYKAWVHIDEESGGLSSAEAGLHPDENYINKNGSLKFDDSWLTCMQLTRFRDPGLPLDEPINTNCSNVFEDECLEYLKEISDDGRLCLNATTMNRNQWEDSPCEGALGGDHDRSVLEPYETFQATHLANLSQMTLPLKNDMPVEERYDYFIDSVYFLAVGYARATGNETSLGPVIDEDAPTVPSKFICMRPDKFSDGSRTIEDVEAAGVVVGAPAFWTLMLVAVVVMLTGGVF
jgi:hypothetical protein